MTIAETNLLHNKAKTRKDGVYTYQGYFWAVKNHNFIAFVKPNGECYQRMGSFNVSIGKVDRWDRKQELTKWLKSQ
jgi:hypothetical protein